MYTCNKSQIKTFKFESIMENGKMFNWKRSTLRKIIIWPYINEKSYLIQTNIFLSEISTIL